MRYKKMDVAVQIFLMRGTDSKWNVHEAEVININTHQGNRRILKMKYEKKKHSWFTVGIGSFNYFLDHILL
jgi:hypothetical protein